MRRSRLAGSRNSGQRRCSSLRPSTPLLLSLVTKCGCTRRAASCSGRKCVRKSHSILPWQRRRSMEDSGRLKTAVA
eukprot:3879141-Rhodomonas_salina.2